jgi:hypothetical protein
LTNHFIVPGLSSGKRRDGRDAHRVVHAGNSKLRPPSATALSPYGVRIHAIEESRMRPPKHLRIGIHHGWTINQPTHGTVTTLTIVESTIAAETWSASAA